MLRLIFVILFIVAGAVLSLQGAFYGLLFYLWNAYFRPEDWSFFGTIQSLRLSLIIGAYVVIRTILSMPNPRINVRTILIWLFLVQAAVGVLTSEQPEISSDLLAAFGKVLLITYLIVVLVNDRKQLRLVLLVMAMSLGFETAKQGWLGLIRAPGARNDNPIMFLGDNNGVAMGTMMLLPILGALAQTAKWRWEKLTHRFVAVGVLLRGLSTYSRGGFIGAAVLGVMVALRAEKKIRAMVVLAILGLAVWNLMPDSFWDRMGTITVEGEQRDDSSFGRLHFWDVAMDMARAKPLTGVGLGAFKASYENYNTDHRFIGERAAHSIWFGVLGDLGYPGLILFVANLGMALVACWKVGRIAGGNPALRDLKIFANGLLSALLVFAATGSFLSQHYCEMAWHMFGLSTALLLIALRERDALRDGLVTKPAQ